MENYPPELEYLSDYPKDDFGGTFKAPIRAIHDGLKNRPDLKEKVIRLSLSIKRNAFNTHSHLTDIGCHLTRLAAELNELGKEIIEAHKIEQTL